MRYMTLPHSTNSAAATSPMRGASSEARYWHSRIGPLFYSHMKTPTRLRYPERGLVSAVTVSSVPNVNSVIVATATNQVCQGP